MQFFNEDQAYLSAAADELEDYLLSSAFQWRLSGPDSFPPLTPGNVLLSIKRVDGVCVKDRMQGQNREAIDRINNIRQRWKSNWILRVKQEIPQRIRVWANYMDELVVSKNPSFPEYRWYVRERAILTLLVTDIEANDPEIIHPIKVLDARLQSISHSDPFVWEKPLELCFDPALFWFLYIHIDLTA